MQLKRSLVIAVANQKGGTGKTTSTINLGVALAQRGLPVVVVDIDPQANATSGLGVDHETSAVTVYEVLHGNRAERKPIASALVPAFGLSLVPGSPAMIAVESAGDEPGRELRLRNALAGLDEPAVVLIDCPPNLGRCTTMALVAADAVLAPVRPGIDELEAVARLMDTLATIRDSGLNDDVDLGAVLAVDYDGHIRLHKDVVARLRSQFDGRYLGEIARTVRVGEAKARQVPLIIDAPDSTAATDYLDAAKLLAERIAA